MKCNITEQTLKNKALMIWEYLIEHPTESKEDAYDSLNLDQTNAFHCPACTSAGYNNNKKIICNICNKCPMYSYWPNSRGEFVENRCIDSTVYIQWEELNENDYMDDAQIKEQSDRAKLITDCIKRFWNI